MEYPPRMRCCDSLPLSVEPNVMRKFSILIASLTVCLLAACGGQYVDSHVFDPETRIRKSDDTIAIAQLMEEYERAVAGMDLAAVRTLISQDYYENAGTTDSTRDDYGFHGIEAMFEALSEHVQDVDVDVAVRDIVVNGDDADVLFEYTYRMRYVVAEEGRWQTERDENRFQLKREEDGWRIVGGL